MIGDKTFWYNVGYKAGKKEAQQEFRVAILKAMGLVLGCCDPDNNDAIALYEINDKNISDLSRAIPPELEGNRE